MYMHELYQRERHADFRREAEHDLIVRAVQRMRRKPFYKPTLAAVGAKLVQLGNRLQDNVDTVAPTPLVQWSRRA